jgi:uncharacterized protein YndB with AHSA1/START domain
LSSGDVKPTQTSAEGAHWFTIERAMTSSAEDLYRAWTERFGTWFADQGSVRMRAEVGEPYWFEVSHAGAHHPHYGRFLALVRDRLIEQTWVTGKNGTEGAETVVQVELSPTESGTELRLTHSGFFDAASARQHAESWPQILAHLDETLAGSS